MKTKRKPRRRFLLPHHLEDLRRSGLSDETIKRSGCFSMSAEEAREVLGFSAGPGLAFPYPHTSTHGDVRFIRLKPDRPFLGDDGKPAKYLSPKKERNPAGNRLYILENMLGNALQNPEVPLLITEGEKKTLKANEEGFATVGLAGVTCWGTRASDGKSRPVEDLNRVACEGREAYIVFDSDAADNSLVAWEEEKLSQELRRRGATVHLIRLPKAAEMGTAGAAHTGKVGLDDYLIKEGPEGLRELMRKAKGATALQQARAQFGALLAGSGPARTKYTEIANKVVENLRSRGRFFRSSIAHYFFHTDEVRTYVVGASAMKNLLADLYGFNAAGPCHKFIEAAVATEADRRGSAQDLRRFACYDKERGVLYVSRFDGRVYRLDGEEIKLVLNGTDDVFFVEPDEWQPYEYKSGVKEGLLLELLVGRISFEKGEAVALKPKEQMTVFLLWIFSLFFESLQRAKPILLLLGEKGSGKTSTLRRLLKALFGDRVEPEVLPSQKEDAFDAAVAEGYLCCFDNVDSQLGWLNDRLAAISTTADISMRKLYTTNEKAKYRPRVFLALTARTPRFRRDDVADRLLILRVCRIEDFISEEEIIRGLLEKRNEIWSELLDDLNKIVRLLKAERAPKVVKFRMADWANLVLTIARGTGGAGGEKKAGQILEAMIQDQGEFQLEENTLVDAIASWLKDDENHNRFADCGTLYSELQEVASRQKLKLYVSSPRSLAQRLSSHWEALQRYFKCSRAQEGPSKTYLYSFAPLEPAEGGGK